MTDFRGYEYSGRLGTLASIKFRVIVFKLFSRPLLLVVVYKLQSFSLCWENVEELSVVN